MNEHITTREQEIIGRLKQEYTKRGYEFVERPSPDQVPDFLFNTPPDAIATKGVDGIVFEVLLSGNSATSNATARFLASEVPKHPGWKFELIVTESSAGGSDASFDLRAEDFESELSNIDRFVRNREFKVSIVSGWALLESLKRFLTSNSDADLAKRYRPSTVVEALVSEGMIEDDEGDKLTEISHLRNRLVHGFSNVEVQETDAKLLYSLLAKLVTVAKK